MTTDDLTGLCAELRDAAVTADYGGVMFVDQLADVAIRRWRSFGRRNKTNHPTADLRLRDLVRGLRNGYPGDLIYVQPGELERLAETFAKVLAERL